MNNYIQAAKDNINTTIVGVSTALIQILLWAMKTYLGMDIPVEIQMAFLTIGVFLGLTLSKDGKRTTIEEKEAITKGGPFEVPPSDTEPKGE